MRVEFPGFGEVMRAESMKITPNAILSRSLAAIVDQLARHRASRQTERRGGMSRLCCGRDPARRRARAAHAYFLLGQTVIPSVVEGSRGESFKLTLSATLASLA